MTNPASAVAVLGTDIAWPADASGRADLVLLAVRRASAITALFVVLPRLGAVDDAAIANVEPVAALGPGWPASGRAVAPIRMFGAVLVIAAIVFLSPGGPHRALRA